jgi:ClpP class serine protease
VRAVLLLVDSGGGEFAGVEELADEIREARTRKPIVAHCASRMESAAFWIGAQASKVFATGTAKVGAIGVVHERGLISVPGKRSLAFRRNPSREPLSNEEREAVQAACDAAHERFVASVMLGRRCGYIRAAAMGDGRVYVGAEAQRRGFVDGICSRVDAVRITLDLARARGVAAGASQPQHNTNQTRQSPRTSRDDETETDAAQQENEDA